jgi:hypothetical protein
MTRGMSDGLGVENGALRAWVSAMPREPGSLKRLMQALLSLLRRRRTVAGYDDGEPPPEGAAVPARPKRPAPTLLGAAEVELPQDSN